MSKTFKEDTMAYEGEVRISASHYVTGMVLVEAFAENKHTREESSAGVRLTREQARELGAALISLADELYFQEMRKLTEESKNV